MLKLISLSGISFVILSSLLSDYSFAVSTGSFKRTFPLLGHSFRSSLRVSSGRSWMRRIQNSSFQVSNNHSFSSSSSRGSSRSINQTRNSSAAAMTPLVSACGVTAASNTLADHSQTDQQENSKIILANRLNLPGKTGSLVDFDVILSIISKRNLVIRSSGEATHNAFVSAIEILADQSLPFNSDWSASFISAHLGQDTLKNWVLTQYPEMEAVAGRISRENFRDDVAEEYKNYPVQMMLFPMDSESLDRHQEATAKLLYFKGNLDNLRVSKNAVCSEIKSKL